MGKKKNKPIQHYYKMGKFTPLYHDVWDSDAYRSLSPKAKCLLSEIQRAEFPNRNGKVGMSEKVASRLLNCAENTASKAFEELLDRKLIERCYGGDYTIGLASE